MGTAPAVDKDVDYLPVPLAGLAGRDPLPFPLFLRTAADTWVLYRDRSTTVREEHIERLGAEGVRELFVHPADRPAYHARVEHRLEAVLGDRTVAIERRAEVLYGVATQMAAELFERRLDHAGLQRAQRVLLNSSGLVLREQRAFQVLRVLLGASQSLAQHAVTAAFLSIGLARHVISAEPNVMIQAGLAGLLHDIGRVGHEDLTQDPDHVQRGHDLLASLGLPSPVCEAVLFHHERYDGSGFPSGLRGEQIPILARITGLVDIFEKIYSGQQPRVGVYDALRIIAQAYRGCFDERCAAFFVRLFR